MSDTNRPPGPTLIAGFEPFGGHERNPAAEIARALDRERIGGAQVVGRFLPVSHRAIAGRLAELVEEHRPRLVIALGLAAAERALRLERFGHNLAHFEITDNDGVRVMDEEIEPGGPVAVRATLPLRGIEQRLLAAGIEARLSETAGTFLCNIALYYLMRLAERRSPSFLGGFIHLPYMSEQVALETSDTPSMELSRLVAAVRIAVEVSRAEAERHG
jgi:pyroglutamyl-peptidase